MNLDSIWKGFLDSLQHVPFVLSLEKKLVTGLPFLYIHTNGQAGKNEIEDMLKVNSIDAMRGKRLNAEISYVRRDSFLFVYRFRFLVPQEKMFCCGNLCEDCIRYHLS